jgi:Protein of unknown function (DUF3106)
VRTNSVEITGKWLRGAALILAALFVTDVAMAQRGQGGGRGQGMRMGRQGMRAPGERRGPGPGFMQRLRDLPPEEQERVLKNDKRFQQLSPERQARIRENLSRWNALSPAEKEQLRERQHIFQSLTPAQRHEAREVFQQWRELPPARRHALRLEFRHLCDLAPDKREQFLSGPQLQSRFSSDEIKMLRGLSGLLPEDGNPPQP